MAHLLRKFGHPRITVVYGDVPGSLEQFCVAGRRHHADGRLANFGIIVFGEQHQPRPRTQTADRRQVVYQLNSRAAVAGQSQANNVGSQVAKPATLELALDF
jgi:hypothetical protein